MVTSSSQYCLVKFPCFIVGVEAQLGSRPHGYYLGWEIGVPATSSRLKTEHKLFSHINTTSSRRIRTLPISMDRENKINSLIRLQHCQMGQSKCCCLILQSMQRMRWRSSYLINHLELTVWGYR